jgi:thiosulfate dehydrogenase [quinone] large subunit
MGWLFLWAFIDKVFGLGFATQPGQSWLDGVSPTESFLTLATHGPFAPVFQSMAGNPLVDWLFMLGLLAVGITLLLGIGVRIASYTGALMMALITLAVALPPVHNPLLDEHIIYVLVLLSFTTMPVGEWLGLGKWWAKQPLSGWCFYLRMLD